MRSAIRDINNASVPDDTPRAKRTPQNAASSSSSAVTSDPRINRCDSQTRSIAARISARIVAYCAGKSSKGTFILTWLSRPSPVSLNSRARPQQVPYPAFGLADVVFVLENQVQRPSHCRRVQFLHTQRQESSRPVQSLGNTRRFLEVEFAQAANKPRHLSLELLSELRHLERDDFRLFLHAWEVNVQMQAASFERFGEFPRAVRGEHDHRPVGGAEGAKFGYAHLEVTQHFE